MILSLTGPDLDQIYGAADPVTAFYSVWTVKEAFSKMKGQGLSLFEEDKVLIDHPEHIKFH